ncbi:hypothetical protein EVAR_84319_1 [Eumeta japonica]|uniref:Uncharacterized protein n=1 Tax=Eumeta variegata TaxID=151549 RepID=A0A4C1U5R9_EUMVA|nr:hypothetical protein EVAR_84319_1 [Eumeta japonica]
MAAEAPSALIGGTCVRHEERAARPAYSFTVIMDVSWDNYFRLSTSTSTFRAFRAMDLPPSSIDRRRYSGYPSLPVMVSETKFLEYRFVHFPSDMHGDLLLNTPHEP